MTCAASTLPHSPAQRAVISWLTWLSLTSEPPEHNLVFIPGSLPRMLDSCMAQCRDLILDKSC